MRLPSARHLHWQILIGMLAGAAVGVTLNTVASRANVVLEDRLPPGLARVAIEDSTDRTIFRVRTTDGGETTLVVDASAAPAGVGADERVFASKAALAAEDPAMAALYEARGMSSAHRWGNWFKRAGGLFLRLLKMVAVPLIVTSLASGVLGLGAAATLSRIFSRTLVYFLTTSMIAVVTGMVIVNVMRPGLRTDGLPREASATLLPLMSIRDVLLSQIEAMIPENPLAALVEPNFLSIISFTIAFSVFAMLVGGEVATAVRRGAEIGFAVMMKMTNAIVRLAPLGVFFLMAHVTATQGLAIFHSLAFYMLAVTMGLVVHATITLPAIVWLFARRSPLALARAMAPALVTAFSSASSNGTLPLTISCAEQRAGIRNRTASFVLPLGATINMDGTALYEAVAVLFIAQLHFGEPLPLSQQAVVAFTALVASVGAAGIPHAGLVTMAIVLHAVGLPAESQGVILAVDRVLDMMRTSVNVWSDACGSAVVDDLEA